MNAEIQILYLYQVKGFNTCAHLALSCQTKLSRDAADKLVSRVQRGGRHPCKAAHRSNKAGPESQHSVFSCERVDSIPGEGDPRIADPATGGTMRPLGQEHLIVSAPVRRRFRSCGASL